LTLLEKKDWVTFFYPGLIKFLILSIKILRALPGYLEKSALTPDFARQKNTIYLQDTKN